MTSIVVIGLSRTVSEIHGDFRRKSHENRQFSHPCVFNAPVEGVPFGFYETRMMGLSDDRKSFKIGFAVLIQYRRVPDAQPASQPATQPRRRSIYRAYYVARVKT